MTKIRMKVRFDYLGKTRQGKFFGGKNGVQVAEEIRQHKVSWCVMFLFKVSLLKILI